MSEVLLDALDGIDPNTPGGSLLFVIATSFLEFEMQLRDETLARVHGRADQ